MCFSEKMKICGITDNILLTLRGKSDKIDVSSYIFPCRCHPLEPKPEKGGAVY